LREKGKLEINTKTQKDSTKTNVTHEYELQGTYNVSLTVVNPSNQRYTKTKAVNVLYFINDIDKNKLEFKLYPNPAKEELFVEYNLTNNTDVVISIYNSIGSVIENIEKLNSTKGKHKVNLKVNNLKPGVYYIKVITNEGIGFNKFIINE